jgi:hypothetical protein
MNERFENLFSFQFSQHLPCIRVSGIQLKRFLIDLNRLFCIPFHDVCYTQGPGFGGLREGSLENEDGIVKITTVRAQNWAQFQS